MKKLKYIIYIFIAVIWMAFIFYNSSLGGEASSGISDAIVRLVHKVLMWFGNSAFFENLRDWVVSDSFHIFLRKTAHFVEFGILGILLYLSIGIFEKLKSDGKNRAIIASAISFIYAISDETHQLFVTERVCSAIDVMIDTVGAVSAILCLAIIVYIKDKKIAKK